LEAIVVRGNLKSIGDGVGEQEGAWCEVFAFCALLLGFNVFGNLFQDDASFGLLYIKYLDVEREIDIKIALAVDKGPANCFLFSTFT